MENQWICRLTIHTQLSITETSMGIRVIKKSVKKETLRNIRNDLVKNTKLGAHDIGNNAIYSEIISSSHIMLPDAQRKDNPDRHQSDVQK